MENLKLVAFDRDDLAVLSAHLQDAIVRTGDLAFLAGQSRFALIARRFDWESPDAEPRRRLTGLHFERVTSVRTRNIERTDPDQALSLLALTFDETDAPSGTLTLVFSSDKAVQLDLECIEAQMLDMGPIWAVGERPAHESGPA